MAYLNFAELPVAALGAAPVPTVSKAAGLTPLEWSVVALAERDSLNSLRSPGRLAVALATLFGNTNARSLADPALEALRRVAVHAWHRGYAVPETEMLNFLQAGFSADQFELVVASVSRARADRQQARDRRRFRLRAMAGASRDT